MSDPVLLSAATAVATKAALDLYNVVKRRFRQDADADRALDAAVATPDDDHVATLADHLARIDAADAEFAAAWRASWRQHDQRAAATDDAVVNQIGGDVNQSVQARDIHGDITFGPG